MSLTINFKHQVFISKPPEEVWDYTQNYDYRTEWDDGVKQAEVLETQPTRLIKLKIAGGNIIVFKYKQEKRPLQSSLSITETNSKILLGGGGSWRYEPIGDGTLWTQSNTVVIRGDWFGKLLQPLFRFTLKNGTIRSMNKAKWILEA